MIYTAEEITKMLAEKETLLKATTQIKERAEQEWDTLHQSFKNQDAQTKLAILEIKRDEFKYSMENNHSSASDRKMKALNQEIKDFLKTLTPEQRRYLQVSRTCAILENKLSALRQDIAKLKRAQQENNPDIAREIKPDKDSKLISAVFTNDKKDIKQQLRSIIEKFKPSTKKQDADPTISTLPNKK